MPNRFHILVVDDEPVQRELVGGFLKKQGFEVTLADSAERALELFRQDAFDLILTDQRMQICPGLGFAASRAHHQSGSSVILVTAYGTIEAAVAARTGRRRLLDQTGEFGGTATAHSTGECRYRIINENRELREALGERHRIEQIIGESDKCLMSSLWCAGRRQ